MIKEAIEALAGGRSLTEKEAGEVMEEMMTGQATPAQMGAFLALLRVKGETVEELAGLGRVMREKALRVEVPNPLLDTCGTGGDNRDGFSTFNISTAAAFVAAGCGVRVAKHGNRAMSSRCGSADVLEALGVKIDLGPEGVKGCIEQTGIGFMLAPVFHPAMKHAIGPRREIGIRNVFNILGPLCNPARAQHQVIGVPDPAIGQKIAAALNLLGSKHAVVVHGEDGIDEVSLSAPTQVWELKNGVVKHGLLTPEEMGLARAPREAIQGGTVAENVEHLKGVLLGHKGPRRDAVLLYAAGGLLAADRSRTWKEGIKLAEEAIDSGRALKALTSLAEVSQRLAKESK